MPYASNNKIINKSNTTGLTLAVMPTHISLKIGEAICTYPQRACQPCWPEYSQCPKVYTRSVELICVIWFAWLLRNSWLTVQWRHYSWQESWWDPGVASFSSQELPVTKLLPDRKSKRRFSNFDFFYFLFYLFFLTKCGYFNSTHFGSFSKKCHIFSPLLSPWTLM